MDMDMGEMTIISESYLFGFADLDGKDWEFVEAEKLLGEQVKMIFSDFETNLEIPAKSPPQIIDNAKKE